MNRRLTASLLVVLFCFFVAPDAQAHAELESATPADRGVITEMPEAISLTFSEDLLRLGDENINTLSLRNSADSHIELGPVEIKGPVLSALIQASPEDMALGKYVISYRVVSADGHPIKGEISFELAAPNGAAKTQETPAAGSATQTTALNSGLIAPVLGIILIIGALLLFRRKR